MLLSVFTINALCTINSYLLPVVLRINCFIKYYLPLSRFNYYLKEESISIYYSLFSLKAAPTTSSIGDSSVKEEIKEKANTISNNNDKTRTSSASITLKSATLPRRKLAHSEIQLDIKPTVVEQPTMHFNTEMQHPVVDMRTAPPRENMHSPFSPLKTVLHNRAASMEPKEHIIPIQRPQIASPTSYTRTASNSTTTRYKLI